MSERFVCVHAHFYQPPRENPWLEMVEVQDSAAPYHDWNQRITAECYAPNAAARILDERGLIAAVTNNYARISFNVGPTLLSWLEAFAPRVYRAIIEADAASARHFGGHGSALAQAYSHAILPLASARDVATQVRWGIADFRHRFGRDPEGMWLPETAVDIASLEALAAGGVRFTVLAPRQARRVRTPGGPWQDVADGRIDTSEPYLVRLPSGRTIALFFYDDAISRSVAFEGLLADGATFARRLLAPFERPGAAGRLVHIATDGETYGHHHRFGEMALAFALRAVESGGARLTNYGEFLADHPPSREVEIAEGTSWSCAHGVERWRADCGCHTGGKEGWSQAWRAPLRAALDWLRDRCGEVFEEHGRMLLADPWAARDAYIQVVLDRRPDKVRAFLAERSGRQLDAAETSRALRLLEMQRHVMLMYTSCGWFFAELSGIETVQVLQYAARALELAESISGLHLEGSFLDLLARAPSNLPEIADGRAVWTRMVAPRRIDVAAFAGQLAIAALFPDGETGRGPAAFVSERETTRDLATGRARLLAGRQQVTSTLTLEETDVPFAAVNLGDHNVLAAVGTPTGADAKATEQVLAETFSRGDIPEVIRLLDQGFAHRVPLAALARDEQRRVVRRILAASVAEAGATYLRMYQERVPLMRFLTDLAVPLPSAFSAAAEQVLETELRIALTAPAIDVAHVHSLLQDAARYGIEPDFAGHAFALAETLERLISRIEDAPREEAGLTRLLDALTLVSQMPFGVNLWEVETRYAALRRAFLAKDPPFSTGVTSGWRTLFDAVGRTLRFSI